MAERTIIVEVSDGVAQVYYTGPSILYPGDVLRVDLHDYDIEDVDEDELQEDEHGARYCGGRQYTLSVGPAAVSTTPSCGFCESENRTEPATYYIDYLWSGTYPGAAQDVPTGAFVCAHHVERAKKSYKVLAVRPL